MHNYLDIQMVPKYTCDLTFKLVLMSLFYIPIIFLALPFW